MTDLSEAERADQVVPGDPAALENLSASLRRFALGMGDAAGVLSSVSSTGWSGDGAAAFRSVLDEQPERYGSAAQAFGAASLGVAAYASELRAAQHQAGVAIGRYSDGQKASAAWHASGADVPPAPDEDPMHPPPGARPDPVDPGNADRDLARGLVLSAQDRVQNAAARLLPVLSGAAQMAPRHSSLWSRFTNGLAGSVENGPGGKLKDSVEDILIGAGKAGRDLGTGFWSMTGGAMTNPRATGEAWLDLAKVVGGDAAARQAFVLNFVDFQDWDSHPLQAAGYTATNIGALFVGGKGLPGRSGELADISPDKMTALKSALKEANPKYDPKKPAFAQNCTHCAQVLPLRLQGYDVRARALPRNLRHTESGDGKPGGRPGNVIKTSWQAPIVHSSRIGIERALDRHPDGSVAAVLVQWPGHKAGGHAFNAVKVDGKVHFVDAQNATLDASSYFDLAKPGHVWYIMMNHGRLLPEAFNYVKSSATDPVPTVTHAAIIGVTVPQPSSR